MLRFSILCAYLSLVGCIGLTFGPLEIWADRLEYTLSILGTNPSFTPVTMDMSTMISGQGKNPFAKPVQLVVKGSGEAWKKIDGNQLNLYRHKIPLILLLEIAPSDQDLTEARFALCHQLGEVAQLHLSRFVIQLSGRSQEFLSEREFLCDFTSSE